MRTFYCYIDRYVYNDFCTMVADVFEVKFGQLWDFEMIPIF